MAIIVDKEKKSASFIGILSAILIVLVLFTGAYFLLFKRPELIDIVAPKKLGDLNIMRDISFDPESVFNSPVFKSLREYAEPIARTQTPGRPNPFEPPQ